MKVQRYNPILLNFNNVPALGKDYDGNYVLYSDYEQLQRKLEKAVEALKVYADEKYEVKVQINRGYGWMRIIDSGEIATEALKEIGE